MGFLTYGLLCPFFPWASLAHLFALGFRSPFTNFVFSWAFTDFIRLSWLNYFILILGVHGSTINPLFSLLTLLWACCGSFLLFSHDTLPMGLLLTISLFSSSFEPICFLKTHLLISWTCDPLFLPLGLNGFFCSLSLANFSVLLSWASFLTFGFHKKRPSTFSPLNIWSAPAAYMWTTDLPVPSTFLLSFPSRAFLNYGPLLIYIYIYIYFFSCREQ